MKNELPDKGYCGLGDLNTGPNDPYYEACRIRHDIYFDQILEAITYIRSNNITDPAEVKKILDSLKKPFPTFLGFVKALTKTMVKKPSLWTILGYPLYVLIGGLGGIPRQNQLLLRLEGPDKNKRLYEGD